MTPAWTNNEYIWDTGEEEETFEVIEPLNGGFHTTPDNTHNGRVYPTNMVQDEVERFGFVRDDEGGFTMPGNVDMDTTRDVGGVQPIEIPMERNYLQARGRQLRGDWTIEVGQDLEALHGFDVEEELTNILTDEVREAIKAEYMAEFKKMNPLVPDDLFDMDK